MSKLFLGKTGGGFNRGWTLMNTDTEGWKRERTFLTTEYAEYTDGKGFGI
jgi:hypothetical protein